MRQSSCFFKLKHVVKAQKERTDIAARNIDRLASCPGSFTPAPQGNSASYPSDKRPGAFRRWSGHLGEEKKKPIDPAGIQTQNRRLRNLVTATNEF